MIQITLPIKTVSESNQSGFEHWGAKARRVKNQRAIIKFGLFNFKQILQSQKGPLAVTLTRIAPRRLDAHDNLPRSFKACVDEIAKTLGVDDKDKRIAWIYAQEKGRPKQYAVKIKIQED